MPVFDEIYNLRRLLHLKYLQRKIFDEFTNEKYRLLQSIVSVLSKSLFCTSGSLTDFLFIIPPC